jgi:hypothetical protein
MPMSCQRATANQDIVLPGATPCLRTGSISRLATASESTTKTLSPTAGPSPRVLNT